MNIYALDQSFKTIGVLDHYHSFIWTERYNEAGDFELEIPLSYDQGKNFIQFDNYLTIEGTDALMIIEDKNPSKSVDRQSLIVTGRSAEKTLDRRVTLDPDSVTGLAESIAYTIVAEHFTSPVDPDRTVSEYKSTFPSLTLSETFTDQLEMTDVYSLIVKICKATDLGFRLHKENDKLAFELYKGQDRSYGQVLNTFVIFSKTFDNVISSSFYESQKDYINACLVATDDSVPSLQRVFVYPNPLVPPSGMNRREKVLETSVDRSVGGLSDTDVLNILTTRGLELINDHSVVGVFEGDFVLNGTFKYGEDFYLGDILQCYIENRNVKARLVELVRSWTPEGIKTYAAMDFISV